MNTNNLKKFAKEARKILMEGVSRRLAYWGFDENGNVMEAVHPIKDGYIFREKPFDDKDVPKKWENLQTAIKRHSTKDVIEEAAYTWFNRLLAVKILEKNNYIGPQLEYLSSDLTDPKILSFVRKGKIEYLKSNDKKKLSRYLQESDDEKAFGLLLINYCQGNPLLKRLFGYMDDYTELLLPNNLLANDGIISLINSNDFITDDDYKQVELIGWLYQFYISDKKNDIFAGFKKVKKARAEDIPAATQIFTPKWIVKYLVENTVGRIWLDKHPESPIRRTMKYLVVPENTETSESIIDNVIELKILDPAVGSGHFLVVAFDLLMKAYKEEGYTNRYAVESIITHNLYGLDICKRAVGLANFSILLKGASYYPDILSQDVEPHIVAMPERYDFSPQQISDFLGENGRHYAGELQMALEEMQMAQNIGSALVIDLRDGARDFIAKQLNEFDEKQKQGELDLLEIGLLNTLKPFLQPILMLTDSYTAVVTNPPYMGSKNMNADLSDYLKAHYPMSKSDLFTVFMEVSLNSLIDFGQMGMINLPSWMFLSTYENLRKYILNETFISTLIQQGRGIFGSDFGSVCLCLKKTRDNKRNGIYRRLFKEHVKVDSVEEKEKRFFNKQYGYFESNQSNFENIPGRPIAYWVSEKIVNLFIVNPKLSEYLITREGMATADNDRFLKKWFEIDTNKVAFDCRSENESILKKSKWFPYNKGGVYRKWYGNNEYIVEYENGGFNIKNNIDPTTNRIRSHNYNGEYGFQEGLTWSAISSGSFSVRYSPKGFLFDSKGAKGFSKNNYEILGLLNSKIAETFLKVLSPTVDFKVGDIIQIPFINNSYKEQIEKLTLHSINISKKDWDSRETSWDFEQYPLLNNSASLSNSYANWEEKVTKDFFQLHENEVELNRIFIDIYGLQDELFPNVALKDITILQDELDRNKLKVRKDELLINKTGLPIKKDLVIKQLLSYAVGCFVGRYRLDKPGLNIAHPNPTVEELSNYSYNSYSFEIDEDAIIPTMGSESPFSDDIVFRVKKFIQTVWGEDTLTENLNFINVCLGEDMEKYLTKKFWNDHKKTYKKKPIYWLFGSPDKSFQVLVYMHRMNRFTIQKIRNNYLLKYLNYLNEQINRLEGNEAFLTNNEAKRLDDFRKVQIECREYDKLMKDYADRQIEFDLDDGVTVNSAKFGGIVAKI